MTITWNSNIYAQERSILKVTDIANNADIIKVAGLGGLSSYAADYRLTSERTIEIDLTDFVRAFNGSAYVVEMANGSVVSSTIISWSNAGRINPSWMIRPARIGYPVDTAFYVMPPNKAIAGVGRIIIYIKDSTGSYRCKVYRSNGESTTTTLQAGVNGVYIASTATYLVLQQYTTSWIDVMRTEFTERTDCEQYARLEWQDRYSGDTKSAPWRIVSNTTETSERIDLENIRNEFTVMKGFEQSFIARLEDLSAYDYWYYSDITTSPDVRLYTGLSSYINVDVATKSVTIPDSDTGKPNNFEIEIKYKRYDAI